MAIRGFGGAGNIDPFIGASAGGPASTTTGTTTVRPGPVPVQQISPLADPAFAKLFEQIQGITPTALPGIQDIVTGGMESPLLQSVLGPMLQRLQAPQAAQRQQLTEATRAAGGLRGSTYGQDFNRLMQNQALQSNDLMSQVIQQVLGTLVSGQLQSQQNQMLPGRAFTDLLRTIAPQTITGPPETTTTTSGTATAPPRGGGSTGWENIPPSLGLGTPMGGGLSPTDPNALAAMGFINPVTVEGRRPTASRSSMGGSEILGGTSPGIAPSAPPPQYIDPWSSLAGGGSYDLGMGSGTQYLNSPATALPFEPITPYENVTEGWW